jgi:hypothetical protein
VRCGPSEWLGAARGWLRDGEDLLKRSAGGVSVGAAFEVGQVRIMRNMNVTIDEVRRQEVAHLHRDRRLMACS